MSGDEILSLPGRKRRQMFGVCPGGCKSFDLTGTLHGDPNHHLLIRQAGVQYLTNNFERFIESNTENSWNEYIVY